MPNEEIRGPEDNNSNNQENINPVHVIGAATANSIFASLAELGIMEPVPEEHAVKFKEVKLSGEDLEMILQASKRGMTYGEYRDVLREQILRRDETANAEVQKSVYEQGGESPGDEDT